MKRNYELLSLIILIAGVVALFFTAIEESWLQ